VEVFESAMKANTTSRIEHSISRLKLRRYTWLEFKTIEFEHTTDFENEFGKAQQMLEALLDLDKGWGSGCLPCFPSWWPVSRCFM
jgi:hypothetical protein